jgi:hypothetical protein
MQMNGKALNDVLRLSRGMTFGSHHGTKYWRRKTGYHCGDQKLKKHLN